MIEVIFLLVYIVIADARVDVTTQTLICLSIVHGALNALVKVNSKLGRQNSHCK